MKLRILALFLLGILSSCKKDEKVPDPIVPVQKDYNAIVVNEGNFQWGNSSMTQIDLSTDHVVADVFSQVNQRPLGDVFQSISQIGSELWLVVNNSQKIERIDFKTMVAKSPITGIHSPRNIQQYYNKAFVTDLYSNSVHVFDIFSGENTMNIPFPGWSEGIILDQSARLWVTNVTRGNLVIINPVNNQVVDSLNVGDAPRYICNDKMGRIWVLCEGHLPPSETAGSLWCINPLDKTVMKTFTFNLGEHPSKLISMTASGELIFLNQGVYKISIDASSLPSTPFIPQGNRLFYGLGFNEIHSTIWVGDAHDYQQAGEALVYNSSNGTLLKSYAAGIIPGSFYFY